MPPQHSTKRPTGAELEILQAIWKNGPSTVRQVLEELDPSTGYTTVLKLLQIMAEKGLVKRDTTERSHVYHAAIPEEQTKKRIVREFLDKTFSGSAKDLILQALSTDRASRAELAEIRETIERIEKGKK